MIKLCIRFYRDIIDPIMDPQFPKVDLTSIMEWARKWQLRVNAEKCESMRITHLRDNSTTDYTLSKSLKDVDTFTDLSVTILVKDLSRGNHVSTTANKVLLHKRFFPCCVCLLYLRSWNMQYLSGTFPCQGHSYSEELTYAPFTPKLKHV